MKNYQTQRAETFKAFHVVYMILFREDFPYHEHIFIMHAVDDFVDSVEFRCLP